MVAPDAAETLPRVFGAGTLPSRSANKRVPRHEERLLVAAGFIEHHEVVDSLEMASQDARSDPAGSKDTSLPVRKKFKTSELPLNASQRSSIDTLVNTIKKRGEFDKIRKQAWSQFASGVWSNVLL